MKVSRKSLLILLQSNSETHGHIKVILTVDQLGVSQGGLIILRFCW